MYHVALLDDNSGFCQVIQCFLSNYFHVSTFTDTRAFLNQIQSETYDLVLVDLSIVPAACLKIQNGCELIEFLKKTLKNPPVLVLFTGWISRNPEQEGRQLCPSADGFLGKDAGIEEILQEINRLLTAKMA
jgi:CheY-like chemotaxis protein